MSRTFTKLFSSITESTVWCEPAGTRLTWITMLAMADQHGRVFASIPGLANRARVTLEEAERAINTFLSPDPYSRTPDNEGRRIEPIDDGWRLLNHAKYRELRDEESRKEQNREAKRRERERLSANVSKAADSQPSVITEPAMSAQAEAEAEADTSKAGSRALVQRSAARFEEFWQLYPVKKGKAAAEKSWRTHGCDLIADAILAHVLLMQRVDTDWQRGYIPHGSTYANGKGWLDEPKRSNTTAAPAAPSKTLNGMTALQGMKHGLVHERDHRRTDQADVLESGPDACRRLGADHRGDVD